MSKKIILLYCLSLSCTLTIYTNMMRDMAVMMGAQLGASIADTIVTNEFAEVAAGIQKDQTNMTIASKTFVSDVQLAQQTQLKNMINLFGSAQQQVSTLMNNQTSIMQQMQLYMDSIISLQVPTQNYLVDPIDYDQMFTNATMYTPQGPTWKNIYQIGNWQYDETTNSFWQMQHVPSTTPAAQASAATTASITADAYQNSVFTEWISRQPYEIICDITLYQVSYPFYVGVMFNKSRWISGDSFGIQKYRTLGIYGDKNNKLSLSFAEQLTPTPSAKTPLTATTIEPIYPLEQIFNNNGAQRFAINPALLQSLQTQPLVIHLKIKPAATTIEYKVWFAGSKEPQGYYIIKSNAASSTNLKKSGQTSITLTSANGSTYSYDVVNDNNMYLYHGVGFITPGAIAQFQLKGPQQLLFNQKAVQIFTTETTHYIKQQQAAAQTKQIDAPLLPNSNG